jgi:putative flippase GtrA
VAAPDAHPPRLALAHELGAFGVVGLLAYLLDVIVFNLLRYAGEPGVLEDRPLTAKAISVTVATLASYAGNRHWTWRHRSRGRVHREVTLFFVFNALGLGIALACLAVSHYALGLTGALADNVSANVVGLVLATGFRFWAYRTHVFREPEVTPPTSDGAPRPARRRRSPASSVPAAPATRTARRTASRRSARRR